MIVEANDENFEEEVIKKSKKIPVLVDFYANWCMPCRVVSSILEKISKEFEGKIAIVKVNVDKSSKLVEKYGIMGIPNIKIFKNGKVIDEVVGALPENEMKDWLKNLGIV